MGVFKSVEKFFNGFNGEKGVLGYSLKEKPIYYLAVNKTAYPKMIFTYAIHFFIFKV